MQRSSVGSFHADFMRHEGCRKYNFPGEPLDRVVLKVGIRPHSIRRNDKATARCALCGITLMNLTRCPSCLLRKCSSIA